MVRTYLLRRLSAWVTLSSVFALSGCDEPPQSERRPPFQTEEIRAGAQLIPTYCNTCHGVGENNQDAMLAPPLWGVRSHYLAESQDPEKFVQAIVDFTVSPSEENGLMPLAIERYGLMQSVSLSEEALREVAIAIYMAAIERPVWLKAYEKQHEDCPER